MNAPSNHSIADDGADGPIRHVGGRGASRRRVWVVGAFAVLAIVLIGQRCMCPDPEAALRARILGSPLVHGTPMRAAVAAPATPVAAPASAGPAPAVTSGAPALAAAPSPASTGTPPAVSPAGAAPVVASPLPPRCSAPIESAAVSVAERPLAKTAAKPATDPAKFKTVTWDEISKFTYVPPAPQQETSAADPSASREDSVPDEIREMSGTRITIDGYVVPLDYDHGRVTRFILLSAPLACCFAEAPPLNRWIIVTNDAKSGLDFTKYDVVRVSGVFQVAEETREGYVVGLYRMRSEKIDAVKQ